MTLDDLKPGQKGTISRISGGGAMAQRLMTLGLLEGSEIAMLRKALGGDPIEVQIMGYSLSLRRDEARRIDVVASNADGR